MRPKRLLDTPEKSSVSSSAPPKKLTIMEQEQPAGVSADNSPNHPPRADLAAAMESDPCSQTQTQSDSHSLQRPPAWFNAFMDKLDARFSRLEGRMESLLVKRIEDIEEKVTACNIQMEEVVHEVKRLKEEKKEMLQKLDDLENRSRRNNIIIHGIPEKKQGHENSQRVS